jgi:heptosyltransferase-1
MRGPRVLIIRLSAIGDIVMASALVPALRASWPDAYIGWLAEPAGAELLRGHPRIDEVIVWPRTRWRELRAAGQYRALARAVRGLVATLRERHFELALDTQGLLKSGLWARLSGAPRRIGLGSREGSRWLMTETLGRRSASRRIGAEYLALARHLGLAVGDFPMDIPVGPAAASAARARVAAAGVSAPYAVLCPFTTRPQKHWLEDRWAALARRLPPALGLTPVVLGGPAERAAAERIVAAAGGAARHLAGQTRLDEAAAVIRGSRLLIGVDTGLTHLGIAEQVPTVALFGSTCPYLDPARPDALVLYARLPCSPCRRNPTCHGRFDCMREHTADSVLAAAARVLGVGG